MKQLERCAVDVIWNATECATGQVLGTAQRAGMSKTGLSVYPSVRTQSTLIQMQFAEAVIPTAKAAVTGLNSGMVLVAANLVEEVFLKLRKTSL